MSGLGDIVEMTADTDEERNLLHHVRGNNHLSTACPLCKAQNEAYAHRIRIESLVYGSPLPEWVNEQHPLMPPPAQQPAPDSNVTLERALDAFHAAMGQARANWVQNGGNNRRRITTLVWIRRHQKVPSADEIKRYYESLEH